MFAMVDLPEEDLVVKLDVRDATEGEFTFVHNGAAFTIKAQVLNDLWEVLMGYRQKIVRYEEAVHQINDLELDQFPPTVNAGRRLDKSHVTYGLGPDEVLASVQEPTS